MIKRHIGIYKCTAQRVRRTGIGGVLNDYMDAAQLSDGFIYQEPFFHRLHSGNGCVLCRCNAFLVLSSINSRQSIVVKCCQLAPVFSRVGCLGVGVVGFRQLVFRRQLTVGEIPLCDGVYRNREITAWVKKRVSVCLPSRRIPRSFPD